MPLYYWDIKRAQPYKRGEAVSIHPVQTRFYIRERDRPGSRLFLHYNPEVDDEEDETNYKWAEVQGRKTMTNQYQHGNPTVWRAELFFNEWGNSDSRGIQMSVEDSIRWLQERMKPSRAGSGGDEVAPPILELVTHKLFVCVLTRLRVRRLKRAPDNWREVWGGIGPPGGAIRAVADATFEQYSDSTI